MHPYVKIGANIAVYLIVLAAVSWVLNGIHPTLGPAFMLVLVMLYPAYHDMISGEVDVRLFFGLVAAWPVFYAQWAVLGGLLAACLALYAVLYAARHKVPDDWVFGSADVIALPVCVTGWIYLGPLSMAVGTLVFAGIYLKKFLQRRGSSKLRFIPLLWVGLVAAFVAALVLHLVL